MVVVQLLHVSVNMKPVHLSHNALKMVTLFKLSLKEDVVAHTNVYVIELNVQTTSHQVVPEELLSELLIPVHAVHNTNVFVTIQDVHQVEMMYAHLDISKCQSVDQTIAVNHSDANVTSLNVHQLKVHYVQLSQDISEFNRLNF